MSQISQLSELLVRAVCGRDAPPSLVRDTIDALTSTPLDAPLPAASEASALDAAFADLERLLLPDGSRLEPFFALKRRLTVAGSAGSGTAPFRNKARLLELLYHMALDEAAAVQTHHVEPTVSATVSAPVAVETPPRPAVTVAPTLEHLSLPPHVERDLVADAFTTLHGMSGRFIRFASDGSPVARPSTLALPLHVAARLHAIARCGGLRRSLAAALESEPTWGATGDEALVRNVGMAVSGAGRTAFLTALRLEVDVYSSALGRLEPDIRAGRATLQRLSTWCESHAGRLETLVNVHGAATGAHGATLLSTLHAATLNGDLGAANVARSLLAATVAPFHAQCVEWMSTGELRPAQVVKSSHVAPHVDADFFIFDDASTPFHATWSSRFTLAPSQLPTFMPRHVADAILDAGRTTHFIRNVCRDGRWAADAIGNVVKRLTSSGLLTPPTVAPFTPRATGGSDDAEVTTLLEERAVLESVHGVDATGGFALRSLLSLLPPLLNARLLHLVCNVHGLLRHAAALRRFMLLTQGDFVSVLMASLAPELSKPASALALSRHALEGHVEGAIRASNAVHEVGDTLARLSVKLLTASPGDTGWDVFALRYEISPPLDVVIPPVAQDAYDRLFAYLWRVKRVEHALSATWSAHMTSSHSLRGLRHEGLDAILHTCHLLRCDMNNFVSTLVNYLTYESLATAWDAFTARVTAASDMSALLAAHAAYMDMTMDRALLSERTRAVATPLQALLTEVLRFCSMQEVLLDAAAEQVTVVKEHERMLRARRKAGQWTLPPGEMDDEAMRASVCRVLDGIVSAYGPRLADVALNYRSRMMQFLTSIDAASHSEGLEDLKLLFLRFDFNSYYNAG